MAKVIKTKLPEMARLPIEGVILTSLIVALGVASIVAHTLGGAIVGVVASVIFSAGALASVDTHFSNVGAVSAKVISIALACIIFSTVTITGVDIGTVALAFTSASSFFVIQHLLAVETKQSQHKWPVILAFMLYGGLGCLTVAIPSWTERAAFEYKTPHFILVFFLCCLPLLNAWSDWLSVSFTRWLFSGYQRSRTLPWYLIVADLVFTLGLCLGLYHSVLGLLYAMQLLGWPNINVQTTAQKFNDNPLGSDSSWLTWLVVTNFIPLLLHYLAVVWGIWHRRWSPPHIHRYVQSIQQKQPLTKTDARIFAMFLTWDRWLNVSAMLLLLPSMYLAIQSLLHWSLKFWL